MTTYTSAVDDTNISFHPWTVNQVHGIEPFLRRWWFLREWINSPHRTEPECSVHSSQQRVISLCCQINPIHAHQPYFVNIHFNIILQFTPRSSKWSLSFRFPNRTPVRISVSSKRALYSTPLVLDMNDIIIFGDDIHHETPHCAVFLRQLLLPFWYEPSRCVV